MKIGRKLLGKRQETKEAGRENSRRVEHVQSIYRHAWKCHNEIPLFV